MQYPINWRRFKHYNNRGDTLLQAEQTYLYKFHKKHAKFKRDSQFLFGFFNGNDSENYSNINKADFQFRIPPIKQSYVADQADSDTEFQNIDIQLNEGYELLNFFDKDRIYH